MEIRKAWALIPAMLQGRQERKKPSLPLITAAFLILTAVFAIAKEASPPAQEVRGLWVIRTTLTSPATINEMVRRAKDAHFNTLIVQVRGRGDAYYRSRWEPRAEELKGLPEDFDPLAQVIEEAHKAGLKVHAWINMGFTSSAGSLPASPDHIVNRHPEWLMVHRGVAAELLKLSPKDPEYLQMLMKQVGQDKSEIEGLYCSFAVPEVKEHLCSIAMDIIEHYDVDGIHLDYIRYASRTLDYNRVTLERFSAGIDRSLNNGERKVFTSAALTDPLVYTTAFPERWAQFLQDQVTEVVERIGVGVHARKPEALLTAAVLANDEIALSKCFQDWKLWLERGLLDAVCPMAYTKDTEIYRQQIERARSFSIGRQLWAGVGSYQIPAESTIEKIGVARKIGVDGMVLFSYDDMIKTSSTNPRGDYLKVLRERVFNEASELPPIRRQEER
ncbi:MAG: glycoside hydrolase family 10 protein [Candidatus Xenobiia bacterium LiM19]